jgi:hypothetical protein
MAGYGLRPNPPYEEYFGRLPLAGCALRAFPPYERASRDGVPVGKREDSFAHPSIRGDTTVIGSTGYAASAFARSFLPPPGPGLPLVFTFWVPPPKRCSR